MKALVIGGSGGIGHEIAKRLSHDVSLLGIHAGSDSQKLAELIDYTEKNTKVATFIQHFSLEEGTKAFFQSFKQSALNVFLEDTDILCICFGPFLQKPVHLMTEKEWLDISFFNYTFPGFLISQALPSMMRKEFGRILVFGGTRTEYIRGFKTNAAYGGAKTALCSLVQSVSSSYASKNIRCNAILPGFVDTEYIDESQRKERIRLGAPLISLDKIADAAVFLLKSEHISGELLRVDGGLSF
jgi:NAD(P)-dependent dehydrogenase (short-subunit alcohol dehydrogenase family)